ncbi:hypothetical protein J6590_055414 [Homalodisca vitripennis]|nr:hypothetical protein J6590_055414 [Homalodisca vitripennis]
MFPVLGGNPGSLPSAKAAPGRTVITGRSLPYNWDPVVLLLSFERDWERLFESTFARLADDNY